MSYCECCGVETDALESTPAGELCEECCDNAEFFHEGEE